MTESLTDRIRELKTRLDRLPDATEPPPTTLQVLGREHQEQDWQRLLFHFLSPDEPHGLDHRLLDHFLSALSELDALDYTFTRLDLHDIQIETEVVTSSGTRPDAVLWVDDEWFICWELKLRAAETGEQTNDYVDASSFSSIDLAKDDLPADTHHYVYLAPAGADAPAAAEFAHLSWEWVAAELDAFLANSHGGYPARTTAQIDDFLSTIQQELTMTEYQENQQEKAALYFKYYDELEAVQQAFDDQWDEYTDGWGLRLAQMIEEGQIVDIPGLPDHFVAVELTARSGETSRWIFRQGSSWAGIALEQWRRRTDDGAVIYTKRDDDNYVHITLYHRLEKNRKQAIRDEVLELSLWHGTTGDDEFQELVNQRVTDTIEAHEYELPDAVTQHGGRGKILSASYPIPVAEHDDFFEAYTAALRDALVHLAVENHELISIIDKTFEEAVTEYYLNGSAGSD